MPQDLRQSDEFTRPLRRILQAVIILCLLGVFLVWRIDSPRVERFRSHVIDQVMPSFTWAMTPVMAITELALNFQSYQSLYEQNQELRRELQQMKSWKEAALQLEQENARLLDLNKVRLDPDLTRVTGVVLAVTGVVAVATVQDSRHEAQASPLRYGAPAGFVFGDNSARGSVGAIEAADQ